MLMMKDWSNVVKDNAICWHAALQAYHSSPVCFCHCCHYEQLQAYLEFYLIDVENCITQSFDRSTIRTKSPIDIL